jgi:cell division protein FtsL
MTTSAAATQVSLTGWLASLIVVAVVLSAVLSLMAVRFATREAQRTREEALAAAQEAREEAARERRLQYELGVLAEMSRQHGITGLLHLGGYARSLIRADSPEEDLPLLRVLEDVFPTELGERKHREIEEQVEGEGLAARGTRDSRRTRVVGREIEDAIDRRTAL